jgi:hypothetical protein
MRVRLLLTLFAGVLLTCGQVKAQSIQLSSVDGLYATDTILADGSTPITFNLRLVGLPDAVSGGFTAGFKVQSSDGAVWGSTDAAYIYSGSSPSWEEMWDSPGGYFECPINVDGVGGEDTIGLGALGILGGLPLGFDGVAFSITIGPLATDHSGRTICLDSSFFPPNGHWMLAGSVDPFGWDGPHTFTLYDPETDVAIGEGPVLPQAFSLGQNYPNPFNPLTEMVFDVPRRSHVRVTIYNILGHKVRTLVDEELAAGSYVRSWDGADDAGRSISSGIYLYRMEAGEFAQTRKAILLK